MEDQKINTPNPSYVLSLREAKAEDHKTIRDAREDTLEDSSGSVSHGQPSSSSNDDLGQNKIATSLDDLGDE